MRAIAFALLALFAVLAGCTGRIGVEYDPPVVDDSRPERHSVTRLGIPPGHLPPPGSCRIWVPGVPPGRQSPPGDCMTLVSSVPPGAWLLSRADVDPSLVEVRVCDDQRPGVIVRIDLYVAATGEFVRRRS